MSTIQQDLFAGEMLRDKGIASTMNHNAEWFTSFDAAALAVIREQGSLTSLDVLERCGLPPAGKQNAIGAAMRTFAVRNGLTIQRYVKSKRPTRHAARVAVWAKGEEQAR